MPKQTTQAVFVDTSEGVIQNVKHNLVLPNSVSHSLNFVFDKVYGEAVLRDGTTIKGAQLVAEDNTINGLYYFKDSAGTAQKALAAVNVPNDATQSIYYFDTTDSTWKAGLTGDTAGLKTRFATFLNRVIRVNGTDVVKTSSNGTSWSDSDSAIDSSNFQNGKFIIVYKDQIITAGKSTKPDSIFISSVPNSGGTAVSWTSGNREIVINPEDGSNITGLGKVGTLLVIFKDNAMYRWNNRSTDADEIISVGCSSQESVVNLGGSLLSFFNSHGVWLTTGEQPVLISRRVQKWIDGMSATYYDDVASYGDEEHLLVSIGDCTVDGTTYNNIVLRYTVATKEWAVLSYAHEFKAFSKFLNGNEIQIIGGDTTARILQLDNGVTDNGTNISFQIESHDLSFGSRGILKEVSERAMLYGINPTSVILQVKIGNNVGESDWITIGATNKQIENFIISESLRGNYFRFRIVGTSSTEAFRFQGLELPNVTLIDYGT